MRPADLMRRTSFRLALGVTLFVVSALVLASALSYNLLRQQLLTRQDARIIEIYTALQQTSLTGEVQDLVEAIATRITASPDRSTVFLLRAPDGQVLAANIPDVWVKPGWSTVDATVVDVPTDYPFRMFAGSLAGYSVIVGLTDADLDDLAEISLTAFGWSALAVMVIAIGAGALIASQVQSRISEVEATLHSVAHGDLTARLAVSRQGNDLDLIATAINSALARLGSVVDAMRQVSADIAHDLRTPLNRLRIHIEAADQPAALAEIDSIGQTFSALLRIAQIESGTPAETFTRLDVAAVLASVADVYAEVATDADMILTCHADAALWIMGDKGLLTQAFANLIENALRHCPPGTVITCAAAAFGDHATATIRDNGHGIPEAERDKVLRRLYRLEKSRTTEGSGLGLALVKAVSDAHGAVLVLDDADPGLIVRLSFPLATA